MTGDKTFELVETKSDAIPELENKNYVALEFLPLRVIALPSFLGTMSEPLKPVTVRPRQILLGIF